MKRGGAAFLLCFSSQFQYLCTRAVGYANNDQHLRTSFSFKCPQEQGAQVASASLLTRRSQLRLASDDRLDASVEKKEKQETSCPQSGCSRRRRNGECTTRRRGNNDQCEQPPTSDTTTISFSFETTTTPQPTPATVSFGSDTTTSYSHTTTSYSHVGIAEGACGVCGDPTKTCSSLSLWCKWTQLAPCVSRGTVACKAGACVCTGGSKCTQSSSFAWSRCEGANVDIAGARWLAFPE